MYYRILELFNSAIVAAMNSNFTNAFTASKNHSHVIAFQPIQNKYSIMNKMGCFVMIIVKYVPSDNLRILIYILDSANHCL